MIETVLEYLLTFCLCATAGWFIEVIYRGLRHRRVVNPGFLVGCCLPLYGVGGSILYFLSGLKLRFCPNEVVRVILILLMAAAVMTLIELVGGFISVRFFSVRLWDYSGEWMNFKGLICPKFSLFWTLICAAYYFLIYPILHDLAVRVIELPLLIFGVGLYMGVFVVDVGYSLGLMTRIKAYAAELRTRINLEQFKNTAKEYFRRETGRRHTGFDFHRMISRYLTDMRNYRGAPLWQHRDEKGEDQREKRD